MEPAGESVIKGAKAEFERDGLPLPYIPAVFVPQITGSSWNYGTKNLSRGLYDLDEVQIIADVKEALDGDVGWMRWGHAGHGINSWAMHYQIVYSHLALYQQVHWGGAYQDKDSSTAALIQDWVAAEKLVRLAEELEERGLWDEREVLVVAESYRSRSGWAHIRLAPDEDAATLDSIKWLTNGRPLQSAQEFMERRLMFAFAPHLFVLATDRKRGIEASRLGQLPLDLIYIVASHLSDDQFLGRKYAEEVLVKQTDALRERLRKAALEPRRSSKKEKEEKGKEHPTRAHGCHMS